MPIKLIVTAGPHLGRAFAFDGHDTFLVGRSSTAHFSLPDDPYFSRMHFLVEVNPPLCRLTDLNSHNGTLVNNEKVQTADLRDGDEVRGGQTALRVSIAASDAAGTLDLPQCTPAGFAPLPSSVTPSATAAAATEKLPQEKGETLSDSRFRVATVTQTIPGYRLLGELGRGGMGIVYRAIREADGAEVAVKTIRPCGHPEPTAIARFLREAATLRELNHPRIVGFRDSGEVGGQLYFVMDFVPGTDAARLVAADGPLEVKRAVGLVLQLLEGLAYAHARGFVHRDVKPANLLVSQAEGIEHLRVADFGLARTYQESTLSGLTLSGSTGGTPHFMPPEQVTDFRRVQPAADQYAAAATLYFLLSGRHVHEGGTSAELFRKILLDEPMPLRSHRKDAAEGLEAVIHRALARKPDDRYPDVGLFAKALRPFA